jgi:sortase, SrtB family
MKGKVKGIIKAVCSVLLVGVMCVSGYQICITQAQYQQEELQHQALLAYKPMPVAPDSDYAPPPSGVALLRQEYPDVAGWLEIPNTKIDYPFVLAEDNDEYLRADLDGNYLLAGSIFMDYRCMPDFSLFNTIIYGHNMKNGSMFGTLPSFRTAAFFAQHPEGIIHLEDETYRLEFFACVLTNRYDTTIYNSLQNTQTDKLAFLNHVQSTAAQYRDIGISAEDTIVTLSTCSYEFADARTVLIGRLVMEEAATIQST